MLSHISSFSAENCKCRFCVVFLAFFWLAGISFGLYAANLASVHISSLMLTLVDQRVSIVGMLIIFIFPLLLSAVLIHFSAHRLLFLFAFLKAFCYSFSSCCIFLSFGSAGWLIQSLLMFSDTVLAIVLLWFWFRFFSAKTVELGRDAGICCIITACVVCIDYFMVSPFLASLFNQ